MIEEVVTPEGVEAFWSDCQDGEGETFTLPAGDANYTDVIPSATGSSGGADALPARAAADETAARLSDLSTCTECVEDAARLCAKVERLTAERDRARGLAARLEEQLAQVAEVVHGMETLRYVGMTSARVVSDVEAAAQKQRAVRAHAADLRAALTGDGA